MLYPELQSRMFGKRSQTNISNNSLRN
jgi:hypothetical protein